MRRWLPGSLLVIGVSFASTASADPTPPGTLVNPIEIANTCDYCHTFQNAEGQRDLPPYAPTAGWQGSMMGNSARDPVFWAGVAVADADNTAEVTDCIRCHVPSAFLDGRADGIRSRDDLLPGDHDGVTCELCHRMTDQSFIGNAQYNIDDALVGETVTRRGPWDYSDGVPLPDTHATMADPYTGSSELCGTCHDVTTPRERLDDDGQPLGVPFNEQRTYSEWLGSAFAQAGAEFRSCADCHMPEVPDSAACRDYAGVEQHPAGNRRHDFIGANRFMLQILRDNYDEEVLPALFDLGIARLDEFVATAATLEVVAPESVDLGEGIEGIEVTVTNQTGHKLPSGYSEGRVMWVEVVATYDGIGVWSSGYWNTETLELQADDQLHTYQAIAEQYASGTTFHLLLNDHWVEDTRIPPRGLPPNVETDPVGDRYVLQDDGTWPHFDAHTYAFPPNNDVTDATEVDLLDVRVRLLYLVNTGEYIEFLAEQSEVGQDVAAMFDAAGGAQPIELAVAELQIPIVGFGSTAESGSTTNEDTGDTTGTATTPTSGSASMTTSPTTTDTDTGESTASADEGGGDGCGCRSGATPFGAGVLLLLVAGLRRRRRGVAGKLSSRHADFERASEKRTLGGTERVEGC